MTKWVTLSLSLGQEWELLLQLQGGGSRQQGHERGGPAEAQGGEHEARGPELDNKKVSWQLNNILRRLYISFLLQLIIYIYKALLII